MNGEKQTERESKIYELFKSLREEDFTQKTGASAR